MAPGWDLGIEGLEQAQPVGRGGFAVVYRAWQPAFHRTVAVKVIDVHLDEQAANRFQRECQAMGLLSEHPAIVTLLDAGFTTDGRPWLAMPFLSGGSLQDRLDRGEVFSWQEMLVIGVRLAGALAAAHDAGVLHRDLKPANVMLSRYGEAMLSDFGIARIAGGPETRSGVVTASLSHAAPEIVNGQRPTVSSDVYGLASTLYALVHGRPAFAADTDESLLPLLGRILLEPVPDLRPGGVPDDVCAVLEQAMAKDPADRHPTVAELGIALQACQRRHGLPVTPLIIAEEPQRADAAATAPPAGAPPAAAETTTGAAPPAAAGAAREPAADTTREAPAPPSGAPAAVPAGTAARGGRLRRALLLGAGALALVAAAGVLVSAVLPRGPGADPRGPGADPRGPGADLSFGDRVDGVLGQPAEVDRYRLAAEAGDVFTVHMSSGELDSFLRLRPFNPGACPGGGCGPVLFEDDDSGGGVNGRDALLFGRFVAANVDLYEIEALNRDDHAAGSYTITVAGGSPVLLGIDAPVDASIDQLGEVDLYAFDGAAGDLIVLHMAAASTVLDSHLVLLGPDGLEAVAEDDDSGGGIGGQDALISVGLPLDGTYTVAARALDADTSGRYRLTLQQPVPVDAGERVEGSIDRPGEVDAYAVHAVRGRSYAIRMSSSQFDSHLVVIDPHGHLVAEEVGCPACDPPRPDALIQGATDADGVYVLLARNADPTAGGSYELEFTSGG